ncbi:MAG: hypothetical protein GY787_04290 [Alteromonadales bacterium]|nr:hypothetical protein [Alteromonadales bacterium]
MKFIYSLLIITLGLSYSTAAIARNSFLVAPGIVNFDLKKPETQSFIITNNGDEKIRLTIEPIYYAPSARSLNLGKHLHPETAKQETLIDTLRVSPRRLSLNPGQRRDIRVSIRPKPGLTDGDYRSHLSVKMLETAYAIKAGDSADGGVGMNINVKMQTGVALYGSVGEREEANLQFVCRKNPKTNNLVLGVKNDSKWRFAGVITIQDNDPATEALFNERTVVLRDTIRNIQIETPYNDELLTINYSRLEAPEILKQASCGVV